MPISDSVGQGGRNILIDVTYVQILLADYRMRNGKSPIAIDGLVGSETIAAIRDFQSRLIGFVDGRVDPGKKTISLLESLHLQSLFQGTFNPKARFYGSTVQPKPSPLLLKKVAKQYLKMLKYSNE
jgi:peptidoglycan hydrolase-like protein with peptidoglycan-binding domain